ncbi:hypothetical protein SAMN05443247_06555 [Bradyrhizobium erythrophlei]|nr:hypothetical protein SAMN05443247_06555 [Bradyrhizobium erythrophlei]
MFEIKVDGLDALLKKFDRFGKQVEELQHSVPQELVDWQREDMRRRYPNMTTTSSGHETEASTEIWPRSRRPSKDQHRPQHQGPKAYSIIHAAPSQHRGPVPRSTRPILRVELVRKLHDRMVKLTAEAMKWP